MVSFVSTTRFSFRMSFRVASSVGRREPSFSFVFFGLSSTCIFFTIFYPSLVNKDPLTCASQGLPCLLGVLVDSLPIGFTP